MGGGAAGLSPRQMPRCPGGPCGTAGEGGRAHATLKLARDGIGCRALAPRMKRFDAEVYRGLVNRSSHDRSPLPPKQRRRNKGGPDWKTFADDTPCQDRDR